jgi:CheY-like chemotaxis protein
MLYSEPGKGTRVGVLFPVFDREWTSSPTGKPRQIDADYRGSGRVMVVDDEAPAREVITEMVASLGFDVIAAESGPAAIRRYKECGNDIDLVMLDLTMPEMSGTETLRALKTIDSNVRAIITSGYAEETVRLSAEEKELSGSLAKPFSYQELISAISGILDRC